MQWDHDKLAKYSDGKTAARGKIHCRDRQLLITDCLADYIGHTLLAEPDIDCEGYWLGAWIDERVLYLDVCRTYYDRFDAEKAAERAQQCAYYDAELDEAVAV
jgi:hypothetical protein